MDPPTAAADSEYIFDLSPEKWANLVGEEGMAVDLRPELPIPPNISIEDLSSEYDRLQAEDRGFFLGEPPASSSLPVPVYPAPEALLHQGIEQPQNPPPLGQRPPRALKAAARPLRWHPQNSEARHQRNPAFSIDRRRSSFARPVAHSRSYGDLPSPNSSPALPQPSYGAPRVPALQSYVPLPYIAPRHVQRLDHCTTHRIKLYNIGATEETDAFCATESLTLIVDLRDVPPSQWWLCIFDSTAFNVLSVQPLETSNTGECSIAASFHGGYGVICCTSPNPNTVIGHSNLFTCFRDNASPPMVFARFCICTLP